MSQHVGNGLDHVRTIVEQTQRMVEQLMDYTVALRKSHGALERRFDGLEQRFDGLEQRFDQFERKMESKHSELLTRFERLSEEVVKVSGLEDRMQRRLLAREAAENKIITERIVPLEERVQSLEKKVLESGAD